MTNMNSNSDPGGATQDRSMSAIFKDMKRAGQWMAGSVTVGTVTALGSLISAEFAKGNASATPINVMGGFMIATTLAALSTVVAYGKKTDATHQLESQIMKFEAVPPEHRAKTQSASAQALTAG